MPNDVPGLVFWILCGVVSVLFLAVCFFLKRTMNQTDKNTSDIHDLQKDSATKEEQRQLRDELQRDIRKVEGKVDELGKTCLTKADYRAGQARTDEQLNQIQKMLYEMKGDISKHAKP